MEDRMNNTLGKVLGAGFQAGRFGLVTRHHGQSCHVVPDRLPYSTHDHP